MHSIFEFKGNLLKYVIMIRFLICRIYNFSTQYLQSNIKIFITFE